MMRQRLNYYLNALLGGLAILLSCAALATPVYLRIDSQFPSGNHPRNWLENHTKQVQFQRWIRVETSDNTKTNPSVIGWVTEDHLLTQLKLASQAQLTEDTPVRTQMEMDAIGSKLLKKNVTVVILEINGSWAYVHPLPEGVSSWVPTESLRPLAKGSASSSLPRANFQKGYLHSRAALYTRPGPFAKRIGEYPAGLFVATLSQQTTQENGTDATSSKNTEWIEVAYQGGTAWLKHDAIWTFDDLDAQSARPLTNGSSLILRSSPLPYSDIAGQVRPMARLKTVAIKTQRWGLVHISGTGDLWWPIAEDSEDEKDQWNAGQKLLTSELFARKIFDMASSAAIPSLKFVSAQGVFRTMDGQEWSKIGMFKNENYPIAIARAGPVFVGPYVSEDQGETFQTWIRYDNLVATLKSKWTITPRSLQILEIRPEDTLGRKLLLKLNIGLNQAVQAITFDQGMTWKAL